MLLLFWNFQKEADFTKGANARTFEDARFLLAAHLFFRTEKKMAGDGGGGGRGGRKKKKEGKG